MTKIKFEKRTACQSDSEGVVAWSNTLLSTVIPILLHITPAFAPSYADKWRSIIRQIASHFHRSLTCTPEEPNRSILLIKDEEFHDDMSRKIVALLRENKTLFIVPLLKICRAIERVFSDDFLLHHDERYREVSRSQIATFFEGLEVAVVERHHLEVTDLVVERTANLQVANEKLAAEVKLRRQTEKELLELASRLKSSNEELEQFAHVASHDLKEPLTLVEAFSERILRKYGHLLDQRGLEYATRLVKAAKQMGSLVDDLLSLSRISTVGCSFEKVDLTLLVNEVAQSLEELIVDTGGEVSVSPLGCLGGDPNQLRQLFQNIIVNALKYKKVDCAPLVSIKRCLGREDLCEIIVEDNGIGFDPLLVEQIFRPFIRLHGNDTYEGSGLGLATCRKIVVRHGGEITAKSVPGVGSTFIIRLPLRPPEKSQGAVTKQ